MIFVEAFLYACGAGIVLSGGGAIIAAAASGYRQRMDLCKPRLVQPAPQPPVGTPWADYCRDAEAQEAELYRLVPSAFWLNPDGPLAPPPIPRSCDHNYVEIMRIGKQHKDKCLNCGDERIIKPEIGPPCPNRCDAPLLVMADHGGEASMWSCTLCGTDFTRAGRSRVGGKIARHKQDIQRRKERAAEMKRFEMGLDTPHDMMRRQDEAFQEAWARPPSTGYGRLPYPGVPAILNPTSTFRMVQNAPPPPPLPCGCSIETAIWKETRANWGIEHRTTKCSQCKAWWEPASNDRTGRTLAQGSWVRFADGTTGPQYFPPARPTR